MHAMGRSRWGTGGPDPLKNHKNIGFPSNIDPDPLKSQSYQARNQWWAIIDTPAKRHFNGVSPIVAHFSGISVLSHYTLWEMFWICACMQCVWTGWIEIKLSTDIISWYLVWYKSLRKCAFSIQNWWLRYVKHHRFYVEWINFVSFDSNHNLEKGPFV